MSFNNIILVLNCGSSSLKFAVIDAKDGKVHLSGLAECFNLADARIMWLQDGIKNKEKLGHNAAHVEALDFIVNQILPLHSELKNSICAIGHRIAHGGEKYTESVIIDSHVLQGIETISDFAPLHNPANLTGIKAALMAFPHLKDKNVAVFDTAFHQTMLEEAYLYALPKSLYEKHGIRRYGFHGTSHYYVSREVAMLLNKPVDKLNVISCHLGNGGSITAIKNGCSVDTSMGFTPLEGLVMGTRCGDIDPAIIVFLLEKLSLSVQEVNDILNKQSGLLGLTGENSDCRYIIDNYETNANAKNALDIYIHRLVKYIGAYSMLLDNQLDALIFTGGIGENAEMVRRLTINKLGLLGIELDQQRNLLARFGQGGLITSDNSLRPVFVIPTNEELVIAQSTLSLVS